MYPKSYKSALRKVTGSFVAEPSWCAVPGSTNTYDTVLNLAAHKPLLFRISHRKSGSSYFEGEGIVAGAHCAVIDVESGEKRPTASVASLLKRPTRKRGPKSNDLLVQHLLYNKEVQSPFVSTTFSFTWALFFAEMNLCNWGEEDVELMVIRTLAIADRACLAHERLSRWGMHRPKDALRLKLLNAAYSSQEVFVLDCIPERAIVSRVPWTVLRQHLPSWFYDQPGYLRERRNILVPDDAKSKRYKRWQSAIQERFGQISSVASRRWGDVSQQQAVTFVLRALSYQSLAMCSSEKCEVDAHGLEAVVLSLLEWSGSALDVKNDNELEDLITDLDIDGRSSSFIDHSNYDIFHGEVRFSCFLT